MTRLQRLQYSRPRFWAILTFIPFVLASVILFPLEVVFWFLCNCPRIFKNLWWDVSSAFRNVVHDGMNIMRLTWTQWWDAVNGNKKLKHLVALSGRQVGRSFTNMELVKMMKENDDNT